MTCESYVIAGTTVHVICEPSRLMSATQVQLDLDCVAMPHDELLRDLTGSNLR